MRLTLWQTICLAILPLSSTAFAQLAPVFRLAESQGPHAVGLRVVEQYDYSRAYTPLTNDVGKPSGGEHARPLQTLVWYPAQPSASARVKVGDYEALQATEVSFGQPKAPVGIDAWFTQGMKETMSTPMWAVRNAPAEAGRFPMIVYAPSYSSFPWENADLCEYLASNGYVVIASPGMGVGHESTHDLVGVDAQARDISFLIGYAQSLPDTDMSKVGVVGFSWGGLSNVFAAARDNRIHALVALDGSLRYFPGLVKQSGDVHPEQMTVPLLYFKGAGSLEGQARLDSTFKSDGPNVLNEWAHGDLISVQMLGMIHPEFSSMAQRNEKFWTFEFPRLEWADYDREDGTTGYAWVAHYTLEFLNAYLKQSTTSMQFLKNTPAQNNVPKHVLGVEFLRAVPLPLSFSSFQVAVSNKGFDHAGEVYSAMQKQQPGFTLDASRIDGWALELQSDGHLPEAINIMKFGISLEPSSRAYDNLGAMYLESGSRADAMTAYRKAAEKDPHDILATEALTELGSKAR